MKIGDRIKPVIPPMEPGTYMGICIGVVDIGEQNSTFNNTSKYSDKILFVFEFPSEMIEVEGEMKPRQLSKEYTRSVDDRSSLKALISAWTGKSYTKEELLEFDVFDCIGQACMVTVGLSSNGLYANISNVVQFPKGFPAPSTETQYYKFDMDDWKDEVFAELPEWIQNKIKKSTQYQKLHAPTDSIEVKTEPLTAGECPI